MLDLLLKNGTLIDGSKGPRYQADLGIQGDRIVQIGQLTDVAAHQTLDVRGKIVAPGLVDVHNHSDAWLLKLPHLLSKTSQGFTTEADGPRHLLCAGQRGTAYEWIYYLRALNGLRFEEYRGWQSLAEYMALLDGANVQSSIAHLPYANVRTLACGFGPATPDDYQMQQIRTEAESGGMAAGGGAFLRVGWTLPNVGQRRMNCRRLRTDG